MVRGAESGGPENGPGSKPAPSIEVGGGRVRFRVDLNPGESTIVSWRKLLKEANLSEPEGPGQSGSGQPGEARGGAVSEQLHPPPHAEAPRAKETAENESKESQANRLSNVIERIERMYAGSSDEEDLVLDNMPDDDEYDTDDSFIDDTELDAYFQVDRSATKHDGFFVNRGELERIELSLSMDKQPKKRRRKDLAQGCGSDDGHNQHKVMKMGSKGKKASSSIPRSSTSPVYKEAISNVDMLYSQAVLTKKATDIQVAIDPSRLQNDGAVSQDMYKDRRKPGVNLNPSEKHTSKSKESELQNISTQRANDKTSHKESIVQRKEGSSVRPKNTLEKAFRELEKTVAPFRPPSTDAQDPVNQSQPGKKRLPPEIKLKLSNVAKVAASCYGRIPKDVINRLMSILGHLMQITTLKRNLRAIANMGLSAKQEKDDQILKMKQEIADMVKVRTARMKSKLEQHAANSDDFQEICPDEREALKHKYSLDDVLENKICVLYDLYVERLEDDSGPPVRKLYEELALLWPSGFMSSDRIKRAIYRAKDRKGLCNFRKDREKIKKKKDSAPKAQDAYNGTLAMNSHEKLLPRDRGSKLASSSAPSAARGPVTTANGPNPGSNPKQEKSNKLISSSNPDHADAKLSSLLPKKKVKQKPSAEVAEAKLRLQKLEISKAEKQHKLDNHLGFV
ncbi:ubinuclein-1-like isoform X1 [Salvia splendens]|uniref:ubinuclein-1-like isoform X1 n=1 Tax=Salvia splendens TaxID=180675 RepID=UPI001C255D59|nr:ubinuclein-1-like isoform X1 [Salvia splendens]